MKSAVLRRWLAGSSILLGAVFFAGVAAAQDDAEAPADDAPPSSPASADADADAEKPSHPEATKKDDDEDEPAADEKTASAAVKVDVALTAPASEPFARFWLGAGGSLDLALASGVRDACLLGGSAKPVHAGSYCTNPGGSDFPARATLAQNGLLVPGQAGALGGGLKLGDVRVFVAADYAITSSILAGVRVGYELNTYPGHAGISGRPDFLRNLHLEARGTYVFGRDALSRVAFAPIAFLGAGVATTDAHARTQVSMFGVRGKTAVDAWQLGGPGLVVVGGGVRYGFSARAAFTAAWKLELAFGYGSLFAMGPELAFQWGF
jgi:hypothetical protein